MFQVVHADLFQMKILILNLFLYRTSTIGFHGLGISRLQVLVKCQREQSNSDARNVILALRMPNAFKM